MAKPRKYCRDPQTGAVVDGVSWHSRSGYYIRVCDPATGVSAKVAFGKAPQSLWEAKAEYDRLTNPPRIVPAMTRQQAIRELAEITEGLVDEDTDTEAFAEEWVAARTPVQFGALGTKLDHLGYGLCQGGAFHAQAGQSDLHVSCSLSRWAPGYDAVEKRLL